MTKRLPRYKAQARRARRNALAVREQRIEVERDNPCVRQIVYLESQLYDLATGREVHTVEKREEIREAQYHATWLMSRVARMAMDREVALFRDTMTILRLGLPTDPRLPAEQRAAYAAAVAWQLESLRDESDECGCWFERRVTELNPRAHLKNERDPG